MTIDLRRFVDIDIKPKKSTFVDSSRPTAVIIYDGDLNVTLDINSDLIALSETHSNIALAATVFFGCGGQKLKIYGNVEMDKDAILAKVKELDIEEIVITYISSDDSLLSDATELICKVANDYSIEEYGIKDKIFLAAVTQTDTEINSAEYSGVRNLVWKYMTDLKSMLHMTTAAYLTKVNCNKANSIYDYCYTAEPVAAQTSDDVMFETLSANNINVDIYLANAVRNVGGNCLNGSDLVNEFVRIVLQQTVTYALLELLGNKIKGVDGVGKIASTIVKELQKYLVCGYLVTGKVWKDTDLTVVGADRVYTIISTGTPLTNGYHMTILPMSALTEADKAAHKAPPIYLILAEQYGIRTITINGEVI